MQTVGLGSNTLSAEEQSELEQLQASIEAAWQGVDSDLAAVEKHLRDKKMDNTIMDRQQAAKSKIKGDYKTLISLLNAVNRKGNKGKAKALEQLQAFLNEQQFEKSHSTLDPHRLPFGTPKPNTQPPAVDSVTLWQKTHAPVQVASNGALPITAASVFTSHTPGAAELAETIDTVQTQAIKDLAVQLHNNPTEIYAWVANNIRFVPSYGSIQGADMTLQTKRGNAMDTASLLIALLRAAHIPARYAYGTVQLPIDQAMNWVGGVTVPAAAANLMQQGGIPTALAATNGVITHIQFEHTWVEAFVDFEPSRGLKNIEGDHWIPMDASYKQYDYTQPTVDLKTAVPFDAQGLADTITQNTTVNEQEGWVQSNPADPAQLQTQIQTALTDYQTQLQNYLTTQQPDATVGDVLGLQTIKIKQVQPLAAGLPYQLLAKQSSFSEVADNLRLKFKYELYTSDYGQQGASLLKIEEPTVKLAGKKLALSFKPAAQADEDLIASYIPAPDPATGQIDPTQLPQSLPGYLIKLVPEFTIGNEVKATTTVQQTMGEELISVMGYQFPSKEYETTQNVPIAGQYEAIALDLQGISPDQANQLKTDLENTKVKIEQQNITDLNKHHVVGDLLYSTILSYFALNGVQDDIMNRQVNRVGYRSPSYGLFQTSLQTQYYFGVPRNVKADGMMMDVDRYKSLVVQKDNNNPQWIQNNRAQGVRLSQMEASVPEQMFSTTDNPAHGVAAVTAINIAASQGQKIFTITQNNVDVALSQITLPPHVIQTIQDAVASGKEVTTHQMPIDFYGSPQVGYTVIDPQTGAGGYHIYGGEDGSLSKSEVDTVVTALGSFVAVLEHLTALGAAGFEQIVKVPEIKSFFKAINEFMGWIGIAFDVFDWLQDCPWQAVIGMVMITMAFASLAIAFGTAIAGPLGAVVLGGLVAVATDRLVIENMRSGCKKSTGATR